MTKIPEHIKDLISIDTQCEQPQESSHNKQAVWYSSDGKKVIRIDELVEDCQIHNGVEVVCDNASKIYDEPYLTNVKLPSSLIAIGEKAFFLQQSISSINIPSSVEVVKNSAFEDASIVEIPEDNGIKYFGDSSFSSLFLEGDLKIKSAIYVDKFAFMCSNISSVEVSDSLLVIEEYAFGACSSLKSITIPKSVKYIGGGALSGCSKLEDIKILCDGYILEDGIIYNSDKTELVSAINIEGEFEIRQGIKTICNHAFSKTNITAIKIPSSVNKIGNSAFSNTQLEYINIPSSVKEIGQGAFESCYQLKKVKLPNSLKTINDNTFSDCHNLETINIPKTLTSIGDSAFSCCMQIKELHLPESITKLEKGVFANCYELERINIPSKITKIEDFLLYNTNIYNIILPDTVKEICDQSFAHTALIFVKLSENIEKISDTAFENCNNMRFSLKKDSPAREIAIEALNNTKLDRHKTPIKYKIVTEKKNSKVFKEIDYLSLGAPKELKIPFGSTKIARSAMQGYDTLHSVIIPNSVVSIESGTFSFCTQLSSVTLPVGLTSIPSYFLLCCKSLKNIDIPTTVKEIGDLSFYQCSNLTTITVPYGVSRIEDMTFCSCQKLKEIILPESITYIGFAAFSNCNNLRSITIPRSVEEIEDNVLDHSPKAKINVYDDCPVKDQLIYRYGKQVKIISSTI